jgi:hypothetical protein
MNTHFRRLMRMVALLALFLQPAQCTHQVQLAPTNVHTNEVPEALTTIDGTVVTFDDRDVFIVQDTLVANVQGRPYRLPVDSIRSVEVRRTSMARTVAVLVAVPVILAGVMLATY